MELRPIDRTDRAKARLNAALSIYRETILPEAQNPERQILYWIEHSKDNLADEFRCFAIQRNAAVVGYLQYSYFREENIFFFEYLCLRDRKRAGLVPNEALQEIESFLANNYPPNFTIVFEVAHKRSAESWAKDTKLLKYFMRLGFRTVDFDYCYPILQSYDGEVSYPADLMVRLPSGRMKINAFEMRTILRCIYFKHYLRWDRPFLESERFSERERLINELYSRQVLNIGDTDSFGTSGDDKRSSRQRFLQRRSEVLAQVERIFGPKLARLLAIILILLFVQAKLGSGWQLFPFVLAVSALYCLAEDTDASRKLFIAVISRFKVVRPRWS